MVNQNPKILFQKKNYIILIIGLCVIALGYILMSGGNTENPNVFNEDVFSFRRIRLAPTVIFIGFGICIYAIFYPNKKQIADKNQQ